MPAYDIDPDKETMECPKCGQHHPIRSFVSHHLGDHAFALYCKECHEKHPEVKRW